MEFLEGIIQTIDKKYMNKKFLKFKYAAIRRYGEKQWTANTDVIEFNPNYTVGGLVDAKRAILP